MENFTPFSALLGGALIGLAASALMLFNGRIAGISGIFSGVLKPTTGDFLWRAAFVVGLLLAGLGAMALAPEQIAAAEGRSLAALAAAGLLVGVGVRMGSGCTSGHGVCGLSRLSRRSVVATLTFMATGALSVGLVRTVFGGVL